MEFGVQVSLKSLYVIDSLEAGGGREKSNCDTGCTKPWQTEWEALELILFISVPCQTSDAGCPGRVWP